MNSKVRLSTFSSVITALVIILFAIAVCAVSSTDSRVVVGIAIAIMAILSLLYAPISISANDTDVIVKSILRRHKIPVHRIAAVERYQPTMGCRRICGSGGFMGYWGIFQEGDIGRFTAFYGKASECFLLRLDNGNKYLLGCRNSDEMIEYIRARIAK